VVLGLSAPASADDGLRIVDLTEKFDRFVMATKSMPDEQRIVAFEAQIGPIANGFYSRERRPHGYDFRILVQLKTYPERRAATLDVSRRFNQLFAPARRHFEAEFGRVISNQPVFVLDSLGELDGGIRELNGHSTLLFGADVIAEFHAGQDMTAFFYHELFHLYHEPNVANCLTVRCSLWAEGLATYVSSRLAPDAGDDELLLNLPEPIRPAVDANRHGAVCAIVRRLDSETNGDFSALFQGDDRLDGFPARMGYYIGYLVASDIGRTHNIHQMAAMSLAEARPLIDASLARMATCPQPTVEAHEPGRTDRPRRLHQPAGRLAAVLGDAHHRAGHEVRLDRPA
jgi:hypothetical protein